MSKEVGAGGRFDIFLDFDLRIFRGIQGVPRYLIVLLHHLYRFALVSSKIR